MTTVNSVAVDFDAKALPEAAMPLLFQLPETVLLDICENWIDINTLGKLDSATCNRSQRGQLLTVIKLGCFSMRDCVRGPYFKFLEWLIRRKAPVWDWCICRDLPPSLVMDLAEHTGGPDVQSLCLVQVTVDLAVIFCALSPHCPKLEIIRIDSCSTWAGVSALRGEAQESLRELHIVFINTVTSHPASFARSYYPNLRIVCLDDVEGDPINVAGLLAASPNLCDLRLSGSSFNDHSLSALSRRVQALEVLMLRGSAYVTTSMLRAIAKQCPELRTLGVEYCSHVGLEAIEAFARHCSHLTGVCFSTPDAVPTGALRSVAAQCGTRLRYFTLNGIPLPDTGGELLAVAEHCPYLQELTLNKCTGLTDSVLVRLLAALPCLKELVISECSVVTDEALEAIATHLPHLHALSLYLATGYTKTGARAIIRSLRELRRFCVEHGHGVFTELVMELWTERLPELNHRGWDYATTHCAQFKHSL